MNIKIFKTRKEFVQYANGLFKQRVTNGAISRQVDREDVEINIPYVAYARYIEKTIHGEDASEVKGFKPSQNQKITDRLQERLIKLLTKDAEWIVLNSESYEVVVNKSEGDLQTAINNLININFNPSNLRKYQEKKQKHYSSKNVWLCIGNHEVYLSKRQTIKFNQAVQDKLDEYWAENQTEDEATKAEKLWEMNEGR